MYKEEGCPHLPRYEGDFPSGRVRDTERSNTLCANVTLTDDCHVHCFRYMKDPVYIDITEGQKYTTPESVEHIVRYLFQWRQAGVVYLSQQFTRFM